MYFSKTIQKLSAGLMFLLFALSITPKQLLHDAITGHKHGSIRPGAAKELREAKNNFLCSWDHQLVESPFTGQPGIQLTHPVIIHVTPVFYYTTSDYSAERSLPSLRGPPSQV